MTVATADRGAGFAPAGEPAPHTSHAPSPRGKYLALLSLAALGIVFGDIGTSPLYALRECFHGEHAVAATRQNVFGVLSLVLWSLLIVISIKYVAYVMRADNRGEGGVLALMALAISAGRRKRRTIGVAVVLGLVGAALLYGDGMITPAISVLSAVEGLEVIQPNLERFVVPITIVILVGVFMLQRQGTTGIGVIFGPVMVLWFVTIAVLGIAQIVQRPAVLAAVSPHYAVQFFVENRARGFLVLGAVFLVVTGGEALYADMGHFGRRPIRLAWFALVLPALLANYFGQGALLISDPSAADNPFYKLAPGWFLIPLIVIATGATIIASQAMISGAFSITRQAIMLGFLPRLNVQHTSPREIGQIYAPGINWILMLSTVGLVLGFRSSSNLAAAYGIAVSTTMVITTLLAYVVARDLWRWSRAAALALSGLFLVIDVAFFSANAIKIADGGWFPLLVAALVLVLMTTWNRGRQLLRERVRDNIVPLEDFLDLLHVELPTRVPGTAVFMTSNPEGAPPALIQGLLHYRAVHQRVILLNVQLEDVPRVSESRRVKVEPLAEGFVRIVARYGFFEDPDVPALLTSGIVSDFSLDHTTFFLGRETVLPWAEGGMWRWRQRLFSFLARNAQPATAFFRLPPDRVVEVGAQIAL